MLTFLVLSHVCTRFVCPAKQPTQQTTCNLAIKEWEKKNEAVAEEAEVVKLYCQVPPIQKMDNSLNTLKTALTCLSPQILSIASFRSPA